MVSSDTDPSLLTIANNDGSISDTTTPETTAYSDEGTVIEDGEEPGPCSALTFDQAKELLDEILQNISIDSLLLKLDDFDCENGLTLEPADGLTIVITCTSLKDRYNVSCEFNTYQSTVLNSSIHGMFLASVTVSEDDLTYQFEAYTPEGAPLIVDGGEHEGTTIVFSNIFITLSFKTLTLDTSGTIIIDDTEYFLNELVSFQDINISTVIQEALNTVPWDDVMALLTTYTSGSRFITPGITVYNENGMHVDARLDLNFDEPGVILDITFNNYLIDENYSFGLNGMLTVFASFDTVTDLKLVLNTEEGSSLSLSGFPIFTPTIVLQDAVLYYNWSDEELVEKEGDNGTIIFNGLSFPFNLSWLVTIQELLQ